MISTVAITNAQFTHLCPACSFKLTAQSSPSDGWRFFENEYIFAPRELYIYQNKAQDLQILHLYVMYEQQRDQSRTLKDHTPGCEEEEKGERSGGTGESFVNVLLLHIIRSVNSV